MNLPVGCLTATITPLTLDGEIDFDEFSSLLDFQLANGVNGVVVCGTTGEGPTITPEERVRLFSKALEALGDRCLMVAGTGSNSTLRAMESTRQAYGIGSKAALLADPYYNAPSSVEIRREYYAPVAAAFPAMLIIPYVIPSRTGTELNPQDLALLSHEYSNVVAVKDATGSVQNAASIRMLCGKQFSILSGDDDKTLALMTDPSVLANGVISVVSNIAPKSVVQMVSAALSGKMSEARKVAATLKPLFEVVTVKTEEQVLGGTVSVKARNPLPIKTLARLLGMPSGPCRRPLGRMTKVGLSQLISKIEAIWANNPEVLRPIESFFGVSIEERLSSPRFREGLYYECY
jgi:4-hydroxy-tetrahydrodipicolinate synthase